MAGLEFAFANPKRMLSLEEYASHDGLGLAELVARKQVTPQELLDTAMRGVEAVNPRLNAVISTFPEDARREIDGGLPSGPFTGVPFLIKELMLTAKGVRCSMGSRLARDYVPAADSNLMARFRRAGLVLFGTTQTPEMGYGPSAETVLFGPVHNPWNLDHSAGGSSGGSGAAVSSGIVPIAHGNDGGGSMRLPSSCNGLVGVKPTRDRTPTGPDSSDPVAGLAIEFALVRSVRDAAALLDAVSGADAGAPSASVFPPRPFLSEVGVPPGRLRIAWTTTASSGAKAHPECVTAVEETAKLLSSLGHELVEAAPPLDHERYLNATHVIWCASTAAGIDAVASVVGRTPGPDNLEEETLAIYEDGKRFTALQLMDAMGFYNVISRETAEFFADFDVMLTPTIARPPAPLGEFTLNRPGLTGMDWTQQIFAYCAFTALFNITGQPAFSVPMHWTADGLPVGVQIAAKFGDEATLFRLASQLEVARPWKGRRPGVHVAG